MTELEGAGKHRVHPPRAEPAGREVRRLLLPLQRGLAHKEVLQSLPHALG